jgi:hypothetical protein
MTKRAPEFRPRGSRRGRFGRWPLAAIAAGVAALTIIGLVTWFIIDSASGDDDDDGGSSESVGGVDGGPETQVAAPASQYTVQLYDLATSPIETNPDETYPLNALGFAQNGYFADTEQGETLAAEWGYVDGYQSGLRPTGQIADVVQGGYYIRSEAYVFESVSGAQLAYGYLEDSHRNQAGSVEVDTKNLANESSSFEILEGTVGSSDKPAVYHRFLFRRGSMVAIVQTWGAQEFMTVDRARDLAVAMDDKARGERDAYTPTPRSGNSPVVVPPSTTPEP